MNAKTFCLLPFFFILLQWIAAAETGDAGIQRILDQYQVSEPVSLLGLDNWAPHPPEEKTIEQTHWINRDGKLILRLFKESPEHGYPSLISAKEYGNFILDFAWIAEKGSNSGIKYRLKDFGQTGAKINLSTTYGWLGCEYQIVDDFNNKEGTREGGRKSAASLYGTLAPDPKKKLNPHGKINTGRIVVLDNHVEHWLNGKKVLQYDVGSAAWNKARSEGKFAAAEEYGKNPKGFLLVQDHGNAVTFEKLVIREIGAKK